jgi:hypothetical protein
VDQDYICIYKPTYFEFLLQELPYSKYWALHLNLPLTKYEGYNMVQKQDKKDSTMATKVKSFIEFSPVFWHFC